MRRTSRYRVLGRAAVAAIAVSAVAIPSVGTAGAAGTGWSISTDAPAGLAPLGGGGYTVTVPPGVCAVDWTVIGGQGGAGSSTTGAAGGELRVTTRNTAGQTFELHPGGAGQDWAAGGAGGTDGHDAAGRPGTSAGGSAGGGGGGAGSSLELATGRFLSARGGDGGGATGGAGGAADPGATGNSVFDSPVRSVQSATTFDGRTSDPGGSGRAGGGVVAGAGVPCPATPPGAPYVVGASSYPEDGVIRVVFRPGVPRTDPGWSAVTGWEVTLDGGTTWRPLPAGPLPDGVLPPGAASEGLLQALVRGLPNGSYRVAVRATSTAGPGAPSDVRDVRLVGTPTGIAVSEVSVTAGVSSLRVSWTPPEGEVLGGFVAESYDAAQDGENTPFALCEAPVDAHSCVLAAEPGRSYRVRVMAGGGRSAAPVTSGVVSSPPVPAGVPASSGDLQVSAGALTPGDRVDVAGAGFLPGSTVTVVVYSTPVVLDSLATQVDGSFDTGVTLPTTLPAGTHTLVATGVDPDGNAWTLTRSITAAGGDPVAAAPTGPAPAAATAPAGPASGGLAYTGADIALPASAGALALALGTGLVVVGRRRRTAR